MNTYSIYSNKLQRLFFSKYCENIIFSSDIGFTKSKKNVYKILSKEQSCLLWKTRSFKEVNNYKYIWSLNQGIRLCKDSDSGAVQIRSEQNLEDLISTN